MKPFPAALGVTLAILQPSTASAQDFLGGLVRRAAESAAQDLVSRAAAAAMRPAPVVAEPADDPAVTRSSAAAAAATGGQSTLPSDFPSPRPLNYAPNLRRPSQLQFSRSDRDAVTAFDEIGRYNCPACEGSRGFDSWPQHEIAGIGVGNYELENRLGALAVGDALRWTGSRTGARYAITVVSDRPIGRWQCKQLKWTGDRVAAHVERMGLICKPTENWHTIL